jgi:hypothetical protein
MATASIPNYDTDACHIDIELAWPSKSQTMRNMGTTIPPASALRILDAFLSSGQKFMLGLNVKRDACSRARTALRMQAEYALYHTGETSTCSGGFSISISVVTCFIAWLTRSYLDIEQVSRRG